MSESELHLSNLLSMELLPANIFEEPIFYPLKVVSTNLLTLKHISRPDKCFSTYFELVFSICTYRKWERKILLAWLKFVYYSLWRDKMISVDSFSSCFYGSFKFLKHMKWVRLLKSFLWETCEKSLNYSNFNTYTRNMLEQH